MDKSTVEVLKDGTVRIINAAEYESSAVVQAALVHIERINQQNHRAKLWSEALPWLCLAPVVASIFFAIGMMARPMPVEHPPINFKGGIERYV